MSPVEREIRRLVGEEQNRHPIHVRSRVDRAQQDAADIPPLHRGPRHRADRARCLPRCRRAARRGHERLSARSKHRAGRARQAHGDGWRIPLQGEFDAVLGELPTQMRDWIVERLTPQLLATGRSRSGSRVLARRSRRPTSAVRSGMTPRTRTPSGRMPESAARRRGATGSWPPATLRHGRHHGPWPICSSRSSKHHAWRSHPVPAVLSPQPFCNGLGRSRNHDRRM
jgi:hypothetical protein